jgi:hypothetical protein
MKLTQSNTFKRIKKMNAISLIKFLIKSQNQHGLHSPFAYDFTVKCLYKKNYVFNNKNYLELKQNFAANPKKKLIPKILDYFEFKSILILCDKNENLDFKGINLHYKPISEIKELDQNKEVSYDIVFVESEYLNIHTDLNEQILSNLYSNLDEKALILINKVHLLDKYKLKQFLSNQQRSLFLNSFYYGFAFKNPDLSVQEIHLRL